MSWNINLVDRYGEDVGLNTNNGFQQRVLAACPSWRMLWDTFGIHTNDGDVIPCDEIATLLPEMIEDALKAEDDVKDYILKLTTLVELMNEDEKNTKGLAFW
jgi:hypothetical protein